MRQKIFLLFALLLALTTQAWAAEGITCSASDVGKVLCTDGSIYDNVSAAEADGKTAVAMIAYLDTENNKGMALALADEGQMRWDTAISTCSAKNTSLAVTGASWMLPSKAQWGLIITAAGDYTALRDDFSSVGGTNMREGIYWSSSMQDDGSYAWAYSFYSGNLIGSYIPNEDYVRACLAFDFTASGMADEWDVVYRQTQTKQSDWTVLGAGSTDGRVLGASGTATYYYVSYATDNLSFTNTTAGGSGLTIRGTVYLYVPEGMTVTCAGTNASGLTGGGAGIELTEGNTLYLIGGGTVNATGGNAANGGNGGNGDDAYLISDNTILGGSGGSGGNGGGGAGAGIGTRGGNGGNGGAGGQRTGTTGQETTQYGVDGYGGIAGGTAGHMGTVNKMGNITLNAQGGAAGSNGTGGNRGLTASQHPGSNVYMASGGGGGGAGGFGGAASNIGTGGCGGGGGGGGAAGNVAWVLYSGTANGYYHAGAKGGKGGKNGNGTSAPEGTSIELTNPKYADIQGDGLRDSASDYKDDAGWESGNAWHEGGDGGSCGIPTRGGAAGSVLTANGDGTWTIASMPAFDVELQIEYETALALSETTDNTDALGEWNGCEADVTLTRTLQPGGYNTFAVPFGMAIPSGWTVKELSSTSLSEGVLTLNFAAASSIEAGKPYLVKVDATTNLAASAITGVIVSKDAVPFTSTDVDFIPTLGATTIAGDVEDILFLSSGNTLLNPSAENPQMKGFRAYFLLKGAAAQANARAFVMNFGEGETTGIISLKSDGTAYGKEAVYTLDGRRLQGLPSAKGVYLINGKKVIK